MSKLIPFKFNTSSIRVVTMDDGGILFVANDVATALGYTNPQKATRDHCKKSKPLIKLMVNDSFTLHPLTALIPESDVYRLTLRSKLESAEIFQDWLVEDVIPSIRKTGAYQLTGLESAQPKLPANYIEALQSLLESEKVKQAALDQIETDKPKVEFAMAVKNTKGLSAVSDLAKCLGIGRNRMFYKLRDHSYLMKSNEPYQRFIDSGIFKYLPDDPFVDASGRSYQTYTTYITGKGMIVLEKKFRSENKNGLVIINGDVRYDH